MRKIFSLRMRSRGSGRFSRPDCAPLRITTTRDIDQILAFFRARPEFQAERQADIRSLPGYCYVCGRATSFRIAGGEEPTNWRETLTCRHCGLINRWRGTYHLFEALGEPHADSEIFVTEAVSPFCRLLKARYPNTTGSEYRSGVDPGSKIRFGLRRVQMEDVTGLTFRDGSFDFVLSMDVLEHVPAYEPALREFRRVLRPDGMLLLTVPFAFRERHETRASVNADGSIVHHLPPTYHEDPTTRNGVLCYRSFGTQLLGELRAAGFKDCGIACYASATWGYLGAGVAFVARAGGK